MTPLIDFKIVQDHIGIMTLNRPKTANSLSIALLDELNKTIHQINENSSIYALIITGAEEKVFCAGADLKERKGMTDEQVIETVNYIGETITNIEKIPIPVIAAINGVAFGGGLELALACDLRISANHAALGLTETSLAIIPGAGGTQRLPRLIGLGQAKKMIYTATPIKAKEALNIGLVEDVVDGDQLINHTIELAQTITKNGPIALKQAKKAMNLGYDTDITTGLSIEHLCYEKTLSTADRLEGLQAFQEKRKPVYKGK